MGLSHDRPIDGLTLCVCVLCVCVYAYNYCDLTNTQRYIILSSVAKMHAACSRLPHNVLYSPSFSIQFNFMLLG